MTRKRTAILGLLLIGGAIGIYHLHTEGKKHIVVIDGFEHGVAFCKEKYIAVVHGNIPADVFVNNGVMYIINKGHLKDKEVSLLMKKANQTCKKHA